MLYDKTPTSASSSHPGICAQAPNGSPDVPIGSSAALLCQLTCDGPKCGLRQIREVRLPSMGQILIHHCTDLPFYHLSEIGWLPGL